jgi:histidine triad (HIT) family protein
MECTFCSIVKCQEDAEILDETDETLAFAPLEPVSEGHVLVIPKKHYENFFDISESTLRAVMEHTRTIADCLYDRDFDGMNLLHDSGRAAQQSVPHFHIHLAPRRSGDGLDLWSENSYEESDFDRTYQNIRAALENPDSS